MEKKIPLFVRQNYKVKGRVGLAWRKPRGIDNKQRIQKGGTSAMPRIGYRTPRKGRGMHPSGVMEVLVSNAEHLSKLNAKTQAARVTGGVGAKKRAVISKKAKELGVRLLN